MIFDLLLFVLRHEIMAQMYTLTLLLEANSKENSNFMTQEIFTQL